MLDSVRKTSKVIVLHEDTHTGGFGAEIAATIAEEAFEDLDAPPKRVTAPDSPVPFAPVLEQAFLPQVCRCGRGAPRGRGVLGDRGDRHRRRRRHAPDGRVGVRGNGHQVAPPGRRGGPRRRPAARDLDRQGRHRGSEPGLRACCRRSWCAEGETVAVGTLLARIGGAAGGRCGARAVRARAAPLLRRARGRAERPEPEPEPSRSPSPAGARAAPPAPPQPATAPRRDARPSSRPVVARIAAEHGIDPAAVTGTGTRRPRHEEGHPGLRRGRRLDNRLASLQRPAPARRASRPAAARAAPPIRRSPTPRPAPASHAAAGC